eukprot:TRINITY_DN110820_c0_g1_i1.p1 TRINITY_DN110820_c0_g1~~TRINITY_DN110820_c0_g1_i1.p1  ORF type:complete len:625 (+),score=89.79 TRINITY_DN110820_c0_g1_i1:93-1967(+)
MWLAYYLVLWNAAGQLGKHALGASAVRETYGAERSHFGYAECCSCEGDLGLKAFAPALASAFMQQSVSRSMKGCRPEEAFAFDANGSAYSLLQVGSLPGAGSSKAINSGSGGSREKRPGKTAAVFEDSASLEEEELEPEGQNDTGAMATSPSTSNSTSMPIHPDDASLSLAAAAAAAAAVDNSSTAQQMQQQNTEPSAAPLPIPEVALEEVKKDSRSREEGRENASASSASASGGVVPGEQRVSAMLQSDSVVHTVLQTAAAMVKNSTDTGAVPAMPMPSLIATSQSASSATHTQQVFVWGLVVFIACTSLVCALAILYRPEDEKSMGGFRPTRPLVPRPSQLMPSAAPHPLSQSALPQARVFSRSGMGKELESAAGLARMPLPVSSPLDTAPNGPPSPSKKLSSGIAAAEIASEVPSPRSLSLCPGLVVPKDSECVLAIRAQRAQTGITKILDLQGNVMLKSEARSRPTSMSNVPRVIASQAPVITLRTPTLATPADGGGSFGDNNILGCCRLGQTNLGRRCMYIYTADDVLFGSLSRETPSGRPPRYVFKGNLPTTINFEGAFLENSVSITDQHYEQLAVTEPWTMPFEPSAAFYKLTVNSNVDVGLILCGLFSLQMLEGDV